MSDGDRGSILEWLRGFLGRDSEDGEGSGRGSDAETRRSDPRDGLLAQHERDKMDGFVESASEEDDDDQSRR